MLLPREVWRDIPGYEGLYQVSNIGNIRSLNYMKTGKVKRLKPSIDKRGYKRVSFSHKGKCKCYLVHRLVAQAFIPNPNNLPHVNHKDENPSNNCVWNLEWCTREYNMNYGTINERISKAKKGKKMSEEAKQKMSEARKGHITTEETRKKISEANKGKKVSEETRVKLSESHKGKTFTEETRKKMSESHKGKNTWMKEVWRKRKEGSL